MAFRLSAEAKEAQTLYFLTPTYDRENLPRSENGYMTTSIEDLRVFVKRLKSAHRYEVRKGSKTRKFRSVAGVMVEVKPLPKECKILGATEYGEKTRRPHAHLLVMNCHPEAIRKVDKMWSKGIVDIRRISGGGDVEKISMYMTKYMLKDNTEIRGRNNDKEREKKIIPRSLGLTYIEKKAHWHRTHMTMLTPGEKVGEHGKSIGKYLKHKMFPNKLTRELIALKDSEKMEEKHLRELERIKETNPDRDPEEVLEERKWMAVQKLFDKGKSKKF